MPTLSYNRGAGLPIIDLTLRYHALNGVQHPSGSPTSVQVKALIDTGASHVYANPHILSPLGLVQCGDFNSSTVGNPNATVPAFAADIIFGINPTHTVTDVAVLAQKLPAGYDLLVGWDVLRFFDWRFGKTGDFHQSW